MAPPRALRPAWYWRTVPAPGGLGQAPRPPPPALASLPEKKEKKKKKKKKKRRRRATRRQVPALSGHPALPEAHSYLDVADQALVLTTGLFLRLLSAGPVTLQRAMAHGSA